MNNKYLPSLVTGFAAGVLLSVPVTKGLDLIILPVAVYFALYLDVRLNHAETPVKRNTALLSGVLTGLWAAFFSTLFSTLVTYVSHNNELVETFPELQKWIQSLDGNKLGKEFLVIRDNFIAIGKQMFNDIRVKGFSPVYTYMLLMGNLFFFVLLGLLGGVIARIYINRKTLQQ